MSRAKNWCFTLNNYTAAEYESLSTLPAGCIFLIVGKETGESGTPHLQGFIAFQNRVRLAQVKRIVGERAHVEVARRVANSIEYCKKDGDFAEYGEMQTGTGNRSDLDAFKDDVKQGNLDPRSIRELHSDVYAKYPRFCHAYIEDNMPVRQVEEHPFRPWQQMLQTRLDQDPNDREIIFVVDETGNTGKTWYSHFYCQNNENAQLLLPGKVADMAYALRQDIRVLFVDAPRSKQGEFLQYDFFEHVKNGMVFSGKYESRVKRLGPCHVVIMMNEDPDMSKLSEDRYDIIRVRQL